MRGENMKPAKNFQQKLTQKETSQSHQTIRLDLNQAQSSTGQTHCQDTDASL